MDAEPLHEAHRARDCPVGHLPHHHVHRFGCAGDPVPECIVRRRCLRKSTVGLVLDRMREVGKLHRILNEKDRDVVADKIPIALFGIEFDGKTADVTREIGRSAITCNGRKPRKNRRFFADFAQDQRGRKVAQAVSKFEVSVRRKSTGMDDAFRNTLMIEMENLLAQHKVFEQHGSARSSL